MGKGGIKWSPNVVDNAKAPGEDSLSDKIKKRSLRARNRQRGRGGAGDGPSVLTITLMYIIFVFILSNIIPRALKYLLDSRGASRSSNEDFNEDSGDFWGDEGEF